MNSKKHFTLAVVLLWAALTCAAWFNPSRALSEAERRPLTQKPQLTADSLYSGRFMEDFEDYSLDQFPLRDTFRTIKSLLHYYVLGQRDNNGIYLADDYAVQQEYPLKDASVDHALTRFNDLYEKYLTEAKVYLSIVPDKGYYLAEGSGQLSMDYEALFSRFREGMPWAQYVDITDCLSQDDYYRTDTHWRQEKLLAAAEKLCSAMGAAAPQVAQFTPVAVSRPFYGVYYGQAALPMKPDTMYLMESDLLKECTVYDYESGKQGSVYDLSKLEGRDLYEVFLSGPRSLLTIENPNAPSDRELVVFRDSFGSSMVPLLVGDYGKVTLVDIRYIQIDVLDRFLDFGDQDVLFLYSTSVLNNSETIK